MKIFIFMMICVFGNDSPEIPPPAGRIPGRALLLRSTTVKLSGKSENSFTFTFLHFRALAVTFRSLRKALESERKVTVCERKPLEVNGKSRKVHGKPRKVNGGPREMYVSHGKRTGRHGK